MGIIASIAGFAVVAIAGYATFVWWTNSVEQAAYELVLIDEDVEIRDYPSQIVAEVTRNGSRKEAVNRGFRPLASYIFAKERGGEPVAMTAPVTQERRAQIAMTAPVTQERVAQAGKPGNGSWTIRFVMPATYTLDTLPKPAGADVRLIKVPAERRVAIRFSGVADDDLIATKETRLRGWMKSRGLMPIGSPTYAYYNAPWTPGFMRRNEVLFDVAASETVASRNN